MDAPGKIKGNAPNMNDESGEWISLMDFAMRKGISVSTIRRRIKAEQILFRTENGRYLLFLEAVGPRAIQPNPMASPEPRSPLGSHKPGPIDESKSQARLEAARDRELKLNMLNQAAHAVQSAQLNQLQARISKLTLELQKAREEIGELKTLIAFYEESAAPEANPQRAAVRSLARS